MTTRVRIENIGGNYDVDVTKLETQNDVKHEGMTHTYPAENTRLSPGQSVEWYIWGEQKIEVKEVA